MYISPSVQGKQHPAGISLLMIDHPKARAQISLFGGQLLSYSRPDDNIERLWLSPLAHMDGSKAIRGGIPVCWPWFGPHPDGEFAAHGLVRDQPWKVADCTESDECLSLVLKPQQTSGPGFDGQCQLQLQLDFSDVLTISLQTINSGEVPCTINAALHSYFAVEDIHQVEIQGVSGDYLDKVDHSQRKSSPSPYTISAETDRIHLRAIKQVSFNSGYRQQQVSSAGHDSLVIWNPWQQKAQQLSDMPDEGYLTMLCVESAVTQGKTLQPGELHQLVQVID